jgi:ankyrin repeat protein
MERIDSQNNDYKQLAKRVLFWISFALKPITLKELQHALAVEPNESELDQDNVPDEELLASVCAGLVTIDYESNIIRLVHYTTQEYFERVDVRQAWFPDAQTSIATTCLTYLSFGVFANGPCPNDEEMEARLQKNALLSYAARYWGDHVCGDAEHTIRKLVLDFLKQGSKLSCSIQVTHISQHRYKGYTQNFPKNLTALQVIASLGLKEIARILLAAKADVNAADSYGRTALQAAAERGHLEIVERLLAAKANVNAADSHGRTALQAAAGSGHLEIVERLLASKADVNAAAADSHGRTALQAAAESGHLEIVERLLAAKADVNAADSYYGRTALQAAAGSGHLEIVERLLASKADVNAADSYGGRTALQAAAGSGHLEIVERLLAA